MDGSVVLTGAPVTTLVVALAALASEPTWFDAVTTTRSVWSTSDDPRV